MKLTIEEIGLLLTFIVSIITSIEFLLNRLKKQVTNTLEPINK